MTTKTSTRFGDFRLKGLKTLRGNENEAFEAEIVRGGKTVAYVSNTGMGGSHMWTWVDRDAESEFHALAVANSIDHFEEDDEMVWGLIEATRLARKRGVVFTLPEDGDFWHEGACRVINDAKYLTADELKSAKFFSKETLDFV